MWYGKIILALEAENVQFAKETDLDAFVIAFNNEVKKIATKFL
jgi:hypothetical protein